MKAQRARRLVAASAVGVLLAGGTTIATAGTASAATPTQVTANRGCFNGGWWNNCGFGFGNFGGFGFNNGFTNGFNTGGVVVILVG
ncbi:hypothetical protein AB0I54_27420 [Streptomyces sp. NPDC050625]|uniref:hypothetical protein n=1 Tax=Streptomyces sp. NPDC050625 TaxID=3154629 RepID=UPI00341F60D7